MIYFTADQHFGHKNIIKYCNRPFYNTKEMDENLIKKWNSVVKEIDTVFVLGDFCLGDPSKYLEKLKGELHLVIGNHDIKKSKQNSRWVSINKVLELRTSQLGLIVLTHVPIDSWEGKQNSSVHLHGHSHGKAFKINNRIDVGVDCWDFKPVSLTDLLAAKL
jgi:calcineurin-like phosphoesterase family protein